MVDPQQVEGKGPRDAVVLPLRVKGSEDPGRFIDTESGSVIGSGEGRTDAAWGWLHLGGAMKYEKPEVRDFGSIAEHTYEGHFGCASGLVDVGICINPDD